MANPEHLEVLKQGVEAWNQWRVWNPYIEPDLSRANLESFAQKLTQESPDHDGVDLSRVDFSKANLIGTQLISLILEGANFNAARLFEANFLGAFLEGATFDYALADRASFSQATLTKANFKQASLYDSGFHDAEADSANLNGALLIRAQLIGVNLARAELRHAQLGGADLTLANLEGADLKSADLGRARFLRSSLCGANLSEATLSDTVLGDTDLSKVEGIDTCKHYYPSVIDHRTIAKSGRLPLSFLRGCGLPDTFIEYIPSLFNDPLQFYSCFISYSSNDRSFAERLHADLQNKGVRCWFAPEDLKIGDSIRDRIDESIRLRDKLLLILSESSIGSDWVEHEVESALEEERHSERAVLFPIRLDDAVMDSSKGWAALVRRTRHIGDFTGWKDHDSYQKAFDRLLRDLKAEDKQTAEG